MKTALLGLLLVISVSSTFNICGWQELPLLFYGSWSRYPWDASRPLNITWTKAPGQPGYVQYMLSRGGATKTYVLKFDAEWRDDRRWFTLNPFSILLEKMINGQMYQERMSLEQSGLYRIVGQDELQTFNITLRRNH